MGVLTVRWIYRLWPLTLLVAASRGANAGELAPDTLPGGGTVVGGQADISTDGARMDIAQRTERAIIDWQTFDIGSEARVSFLQPTDTSVALNRVSGATASRLEGQLTANGQVFLVNPNGLLFGGGARVDASAFVASTLNISDNDFLTGRYSFSGAGGAIENFGTISAAPGGYLAFIAPTITNAGTLNAPQGTAALGAGERVTLNFSGNRLLGLSVEAETLDTLIDNRQAIRAEGGAILLTAAGAESVTRSVINQAGVLEASSLTEDGGEIVLSAGDDIVLGSSSLTAADGERGGDIRLQAHSGALLADGLVSARGADGAGGTVELLGHDVGLINAARVDASGGAGGGTVLVGGDYQGSNPAIQNASRTFVGDAAAIVADARDDGDGGKVIVWADDATQMYGAIGARGGANGGDGGLVEVSGKRWLDFQGQADLRAPNGTAGTLLLDPTDITISGAASTPTSAFGGGVFSNSTTTPSNLNVATLTSQLALGNVTVSTASALAGQGDITVNNAINYASANSLTLSATRTVTLVAGSGGINNSGIGAVTLAGGAAGSIAINESITTGGGAIALTSGTAGVTLAAAKSIDAGSGTIAINAGGGAANFTTGTLQTSNATASAVGVTNAAALTLGNVALTGGGTLSVNHSGAGTQSAGTSISGTGGLTKAGAGTLLLSQANSYSGPTTVSGGTLAVTGGNAIGDTGAVSLADAAGVALELRASETIGSLAGGGAAGGNVTSTVAATLTAGRDGTSTNFAGVIQNGAGALGLVKEGAGTFTLTGANTYTGTTAASGGTLALAGAAGSLTVSNLTVNSGARLLLDNTAANNGNRIAGTLTLNGGEFAVTGNAAANTTETLGALSLTSGYSTITLTPDAARNTQVTFASLARTAGASALFRGNNLGANTVASQTAGGSNIVFTAAPALTGGGGNSGTATVSIVAGAIGSGGASGSTGAGTDFLTYNPPTGGVNGLRPLLATEYAAAPAANVNLRLTANRTADDTFTINSLLLSGGVTYNYNATGGANTLTIGSGNVLSVGGTNTIQPTLATGAVAFGATDAKLFTVSDLILGANAAVTGTGILGKSGAGVLLESRSVARTGGIIVNSGTLRAGINNSFVSQAMTVRAAGALDLNGFNQTVSALTLESGATTGANVATGAGTLTLGGNVTLNANGTGATGATVSGNLAAAATRTFTVNNGVAAGDLSVSGVISGAGGLIKAGTGTLALSGANTYTGATTVNAGTLSASTLANGGAASSVGASTNAAANLVLGGGILQYNGASVATDRNYTLTAATTSSINVANAATNLTLSGASTATTGALTKLGAGTLTLSGANLYTGLTTVAAGTLTYGASNALAAGAVTVTGGATFDMGTFSDTVGAVTLTNGTIAGTTGTLTGASYAVVNGLVSATLGGAGGLTKSGAGTVTLTGVNTYTGATTVGGGILAVTSLGNGGVASSIGASNNGAANLVFSNGILRYGGASAAIDRSYTLTAGTTGSIDVTNAATILTVGGASTATNGALTKLGAGTLTLTGANLNTGATTIRAGTLQVGNGGIAGNLGTGGVANQGTLVLDRSNAMTLANVVSGFGELIKQGGGTTTLSGANTYTGATTINAGTLQLSAANRIADASAVTVASGATLNLANFSDTVGSIAGAGNITLGTGTLTSGGNNASTTFSGVISGTGGIVKAGTGTLTLMGANTYSGATTVNAGGTLVAANATALGATASGTTVAAGATLDIANVALAGEALTLAGTGVGGAGALRGTGTASASGNVGMAAAGTIGTTSAASSLTLSGIVTAPTTLTIAGAGNVTAVNAANNFGTIAIPAAGNVSVRDANAITINASTLSGALSVRAAGALTVAGAISAAGAGDALVLSGGRFVNTVGAAALSATNGRWLVWSSNASPFGGATPDVRNGLVYDFKQYAATYGVTAVAQATGNGFLYSLAPSLTPGLTGTTSKGYDGTTAATLLAGNFTAAGAVDGDTVTLSSTGSTYADRNVGTGKVVTATGIGATASNGSATVYGYSLASTTANANIGTITPASLTVTAQADSRVYNGTTSSSIAPLVSGTTYDSVGSAATQVFDDRNAGTGKTLTASGLVMADGNSGANYAISYVNNTAGVITPAGVTVTAQADSRTYDGTTASSAAPVLSGTTYDAVGTAATQVFDNRNAGTGKTLTASGLVMADGNAGANYAVSYVNNTAGVITPAALTVTAQADSRIYDGTTASAAAPVLSGTTYDAVGSAATQVFDDRNAGTGKTLTASGLVMSDGNAGANYAINYVTNTAGVITPASLTVTAQADSRIYDGTAVSSVAPVLSGTTYDAVGTAALQSFDNRNVGAGKTLTAGGLVMADGNGGANYAVNYVNDTAGVITPAALTVTAQADTRVYDGTTASAATPVLSGTTYDAVGTAATQVFDDRNAGTGKTLTASGLVMADGNAGANYAINYVTNTAGVITPASLTVTAQADSRGYDGTTSSSVAPVLSGTTYDAVGSAATQVFDNRNAGTGKTLTASGLVMADGNAGANYTIGYVNNTAGVITPAALTVTSQADSRVYDGTTASSVAPVLSGTTYDAVGTAALQTFDDRNVGAGKTLTASGLAMADGNGGANYAISYVNNTAGVITPAGLTVTAQADTRVYEGTTASAATPFLSGTTYDAVGTAATQVFDDRNAGTGKTLTASGLVMADGNGGANYAVNYVTNTAGVITPASLTVTAQVDSRIYDGTTASAAAPVLSGTTYDSVGTAATQVFDDRNAGTGKTLTASGLVMADGNAGANYAVSYVTNTAGVITPASLTVTAQADGRVYDGTAVSSVAPVLSGTTYDAVGSAATQVFDNRNAGTGKALTASGLVMADGNGGANYAVSYVNNTAGVITPAALTVTAQADTRVYNGATSSSVAPVLSGATYDAIGTAATQSFDDRNVGAGKTLTASGLAMADGNGGANYAISYVNNTAGVITPAGVTVTAQADSRIYDGTAASSVAPVLSGATYDAVGTAATQVYDNRNAGTGKTLTASGLVMADGNGGANYAISYVNDTAGVITPAGLTVTAQADSRVYDGTAVSSVAPVLSGTTYDAVGTAATQVFDDRNAGTGKTLTATGLVLADGNGGANYAITYVNNTAGVITPAALTVTAQADSRTYDGTTASSVAPLLSGTAYDAVGATATQTFDNRNAGTGKTLAASGLVMADGNGGANYAVNYVNNTAGVITPASLTVTAQADSRGYDGTTASSAGPVLSGATYDAVGTAATQSFDNRNVGTGKILAASGLVMADANGGANYAVSYVNNNSGVITPAALTVTAQADSRIYDGTTSSSAAPVLSGTTYDAVGTAATQSFDNRNAGTGKTLTASGLLMADGNGGANYTLSYVTNTAGVITPAALIVTAQADSRVYDGTTASSAAPVLSGTTYDAVGTAATQVFDNRNAGTGKTLTASGLVMVDGNSGANYATSYVNSTAGVITPAALTVTAQADSRAYDGTTASGATPVLSGATYDAVGTAATQNFANRNAGTGKTLIASGLVMADGNAGANYAVNYVNNATGVITRASLTVTAQADSRTYNGTTASSVAPVLSGTTYDALGTAATQLFDNRNVGTGKMLTATGLLMADGNGGANYTVNYVNNTAGVITPASLTVTAQADNRVYNGTVSSSIAPVLSGTTYDVVGIAATQTFDNRNAGTGKTLTAGGLVMGDSNGGANYAISYVDSAAGVITPASLSITADDAQRQAGAPNPAFTGTYSGFVPGDSPASLNGTLDFQTAATTSSLPGSYAITPFGQSSSNYIISYVDGVLVVTRFPSPPEFPDWARFDAQSIAAPYTTPTWSSHQLPVLSLTVGTGGLNVDE